MNTSYMRVVGVGSVGYAMVDGPLTWHRVAFEVLSRQHTHTLWMAVRKIACLPSVKTRRFVRRFFRSPASVCPGLSDFLFHSKEEDVNERLFLNSSLIVVAHLYFRYN